MSRAGRLPGPGADKPVRTRAGTTAGTRSGEIGRNDRRQLAQRAEQGVGVLGGQQDGADHAALADAVLDVDGQLVDEVAAQRADQGRDLVGGAAASPSGPREGRKTWTWLISR